MTIQENPYSEENGFTYDRVNAAMGILSQTEGFWKLSDIQRGIIEQSLRIQEEAERTDDYASALAIIPADQNDFGKTLILQEADLIFEQTVNSWPDPATRLYRKAQNLIVRWYCHAALNNLEHNKPLDTEPDVVPDTFYDAKNNKIQGFADVQQILQTYGYPCAVHLEYVTHIVDADGAKTHSFLALGPGPDGEIVVWQKVGHCLPFEVTTLYDVYSKYGTFVYWAVRPLQTQTS